jgi:predicted CopG family antitoxin
MATKTISIREDVYDRLKNLKKENESFSDVIGRLTNRRKSDMSEYFGALNRGRL